MFCHLLVLPFYAIFMSGVKVGLFFHMLCFSSIDRFEKPPVVTGIIGLSVLLMPIQAVVLAILFPLLLVTRFYQILKLFFTKILGTCCLGCCRCCCF